MTSEDIMATQEDFVEAALNAIKAGCDGIEIHSGNGYVSQWQVQGTMAEVQVPV
jgi:N-ethylmaleimide reductase